MWSHWNSDYIQAYVPCILQPELSVRVGTDGGTSRTFHCEGLFQLPWQSAAIKLPQGKLSLNSNLYSAVFLALNLACFAFISVQSMKGEQSIKISSQLCGKFFLSMLQYTWQTRLNSS